MGAGGVDLDDLFPVWIPLPIREVSAHHQQRVTGLESLLCCRVANQSGLTDLKRVVMLQPLLGLQGEHHRRCQRLGNGQYLRPGFARSLTNQHRH